MKINPNNHSNLVNFKNESQKKDPFDLNLEITELRLNGNGMVPAPTIHCGGTSLVCSNCLPSMRCR